MGGLRRSLDFGPIFGAWEADFGRTYVLGADPAKLAIRDALEPLWSWGRDRFDTDPDITGGRLYAAVVERAAELGWEFGAAIAGHLVGEFPHKRISGTEVDTYITEGSDLPMRRPDPTGRACHWILEIHLVDRAGGSAGSSNSFSMCGRRTDPHDDYSRNMVRHRAYRLRWPPRCRLTRNG